MSLSTEEIMEVVANQACVAQMQIEYRTQYVPNLWNGSVWEEDLCSYSETTAMAEDLSQRAWADIDPNERQSFFARAFVSGAFDSEDAFAIKQNTVAAIAAWVSSKAAQEYSSSMLGEIEFLAAADEIANHAEGKLADLDPESEQAEVLRNLERRGRDYVNHRNEFLAGIGLT